MLTAHDSEVANRSPGQRDAVPSPITHGERPAAIRGGRRSYSRCEGTMAKLLLPERVAGNDDAAAPSSLPRAMLLALRPRQCVTKNAIVFAALVFSRRILQPIPFLEALLAFGLFCAISGAVYVVND